RGTQRAEDKAVAEQQVVRGRRGRGQVGAARRMDANPVAVVGHHMRLVERDPATNVIAECLADDRRVVGEAQCGIAYRPATRILERLRQVPVVERGDRLYAPVTQ